MRGHFRSRDKDGGHTLQSTIAKNPMQHANFMAPCFIEQGLLLMEFLHCGNRDFQLLFSSDLDPMTFIYEVDLYFQEMYRMCDNELCTSMLSKVIAVHLVTRDGQFRSLVKDGGYAMELY